MQKIFNVFYIRQYLDLKIMFEKNITIRLAQVNEFE